MKTPILSGFSSFYTANFQRPILHLHFGTNKSRRLDSKKLDVFGLFAGDIYFISTLWSEWRGSNSRPPHPKYIIKSFSGHFRHFIAISSGKHLLFGTLVSTVSMCSGNDCGMKCGRKRYSPNKKFCSGSLLSVVCYL